MPEKLQEFRSCRSYRMKESELSPSADFLKRGKRVRRDALLTVDKPSRLTFRAAERRTPPPNAAERRTPNAKR
jgi:hypothetical protein